MATDGSAPDPGRGLQIPGVSIDAEIGRGGFATVYRAHQDAVRRDVAVKVDVRRLVDERDRRRFLRETMAAGRVSAHPNIVTLYDAGTSPSGQPYLVMELCPAGSIGERLRTTGAIDAVEVAAIGVAIADALAAAHSEGILHRDVKPDNILITRYGAPALTDFGLATLPSQSGELSVTLDTLTPAYAAPETFELANPAPAADIYALGASLYAMLRGRPPHFDDSGRAPSISQLLILLNRPLPALPQVAGADRLMPILWRATARRPSDRFASAAEFRDALSSAAIDVLGSDTKRVLPSWPGSPASPTQPAAALASSAPASTSTQPAAALASSTPPLPMGAPQRAVEALVGSPPVEMRPAGKRRDSDPNAQRKIWALVAAGIAVVLGVGVGAAVVFGGGNSDQDKVQDKVQAGVTSATTMTTSATSDAAQQPPPVGGCFRGLVTISDFRTAAAVESCQAPHYWEAFGSGLLSQSTTSVAMIAVSKDANVLDACSKETLAAYLGKDEALETFDIEVLPPREAALSAGDRGFLCLAARQSVGEVTTPLAS